MRKISKAYLGTLLLALGGCYLGGETPDELVNPDDGPDPTEDPTVDPPEDTTDPTEPPPEERTCADERQWAVEFFDGSCSACHSPGSIGANGFDVIPNLELMQLGGYLSPRDAAGSPVFQQLEAGEMPPGAPVEKDVVERLGAFIDDCIEPLPKQDCTDNEPLTIYDQLELMIDDIQRVDLDDRGFTRYFTLTHLYNIGYCEEDLDVYVQAVSHLTNALSSEPLIVKPEAVEGSYGTLLRIDIRDYGWDLPVGEFANKWEALIESSAYAVERLEELAETLKAFSGTRIPFLPGDAFIDVASQPPLYHDLANVPELVSEVAIRFGIDIEQAVADREVARAGVLNSGVSSQNRLVERIQVRDSANSLFVWSYDFANDAREDQNLFASPLDFVQDGGEAIYTQPNGLYAFMLVVAEGRFDGRRIDLGPDAVVTDPGQPDGTVRNGISCFSCHQRGMINLRDQVRPFVETSVNFDAQTKDLVNEVYPEADEFNALLDLDSENFQRALQKAGVDIEATTAPVTAVFSLFDVPVDRFRAAAELGVDPEQFLIQLGGLDNGLAPLREGSIKRDTWDTLFADTVCALKIGVTAACESEEVPEDPEGE